VKLTSVILPILTHISHGESVDGGKDGSGVSCDLHGSIFFCSVCFLLGCGGGIIFNLLCGGVIGNLLCFGGIIFFLLCGVFGSLLGGFKVSLEYGADGNDCLFIGNTFPLGFTCKIDFFEVLGEGEDFVRCCRFSVQHQLHVLIGSGIEVPEEMHVDAV